MMQEHEFSIFHGEKFHAFADKHGIDAKLFSKFAERAGIYDPQKALEAFSERFAGMLISSRWLRGEVQQGDMWAIELQDDKVAVFITEEFSLKLRLEAATRQAQFSCA